MTISEKSIEPISPLIMAIENGRNTSPPRPIFSAMGRNPAIAARFVISTGLNRMRQAS